MNTTNFPNGFVNGLTIRNSPITQLYPGNITDRQFLAVVRKLAALMAIQALIPPHLPRLISLLENV